jgi:hypothetical protein
MSGTVERFPMRHASVIWILRECSGWLVLVRNHGWLHSNLWDAIADAQRMSANCGLPIRLKVPA